MDFSFDSQLHKYSTKIITQMRSIFIFFPLLIVVLVSDISGTEGFPPETKSCNYTVTIETTCTKGADTSNHISLRFGDTRSNDVLVRHLNTKHMRQVDPLEPAELDESPKKPFQQCTVDEFRVTGPCVHAPICYLYLKSKGTDAWRPGFVQVRVMHPDTNLLSSRYFYFRRYLPNHVWHGHDSCDAEVTPFGVKHPRKVFPVMTKSPRA